MSETYTVEDGDHLPKIAADKGFRDYRTIWKHADNKALRDKRKSPSILMPGDEVVIPDKQTKEDLGKTDKRHVFRLLAEPLMLRLRLLDLDDKPVVGKPCVLVIDGKSIPVKTNDKGMIEQEIARTAKRGELTIDELTIPVQIGFLHPLDEISGWRARLNNLGYNAGESDDPDDPQLRSAVEEFQCEYLGPDKVDGICGEQTQKKLKEMHGC